MTEMTSDLHVGPEDMVFNEQDGEIGIQSGGFSVKSILMKAGLSPIMTVNTQSGGGKGEKVSDLFENLVVPTWALSYDARIIGVKCDDSEESDSEDEDESEQDKDYANFEDDVLVPVTEKKMDEEDDDHDDNNYKKSKSEVIDDDLHDKLLELVMIKKSQEQKKKRRATRKAKKEETKEKKKKTRKNK